MLVGWEGGRRFRTDFFVGDLVLATGPLSLLMVSPTLCETGAKTAGARREGNRRFALSPTGSTHRGLRCASPMTGPLPLGPGFMTGTKRHLVLGHGPAPPAPEYTKARRAGTGSLQFTGGRGSRATRGLYGLGCQENKSPRGSSEKPPEA